jgi:hypothetical protein
LTRVPPARPLTFLGMVLVATLAHGAEPTGAGFVVGTDAGFGTPTGYLGFTAGWRWNERWSADLGYGWGETGRQFALITRVCPLIGKQRWMLETGPSLALNGPGVGGDIEHEEDIVPSGVYHAAWWNTAIGIEMPSGRRGTPGYQKVSLRFRIGCAARLSENMSPLLREDSELYQLAITAPEVARDRLLGYVSLGISVRL